jgi:KaiC/GvpD/RAD55 family RecA-like ATPase
MAGRITKKEFEAFLVSRVADILEEHSNLLIQSGFMDRMASGIFSDKTSTGITDLDLFMNGGYPKNTALLLCGPPSDERNLLLNSFVGTGLSKGDPCIYVSSAQPPENIKRQFGALEKNLLIIDCYTNRIQEVDTISREGNVITSPIEISVVSVAISRGLDRETETTKRAVVDILPTYLVFQTVEKLYLDLMEIIDDLRKAGYTTMFSLNPYYIKDEGAISTLEELFDGIMYVERTADSTGMKNEISMRIDKMAGQPLKSNTTRIQKPEKLPWIGQKSAPSAPIELNMSTKEDYTPVEA